MVEELVMTEEVRKPLFRDLDASESDGPETSQIESLCMSCGENGVTRLLLTKIPLFREVILMSFSCPHCHYANNEIQPGGPIQELGVKYSLQTSQKEDLNRLVVKANTASVRIPHLDFEVPPNTQKGKVSTIESILSHAIEDIEREQPIRKVMHPEIAEKLDVFIQNLKKCLDFDEPFVLELDDPAGNSFVENKLAPSIDPNLTVIRYHRSSEQDQQLGIVAEEKHDEEEDESAPCPEEIISFHTNCPHCQSPIETRMKTIDIPHFKEVIIMATTCDLCGFRSQEVKSGAGIEPTGIRLTLHLTDESDLSRDILKSETCSLAIPELEFELQSGTLGGQFTTVEGILTKVKEQLLASHPFAIGDSGDMNSKMNAFIEELDKVILGTRLDVRFILDDPAGNSYVQNIYAPDEDPELMVERYERTFQQNEELGLNDMRTENYQTEN